MKRRIVLCVIAVLLQIAAFGLLGIIQSIDRSAMRTLLVLASLLMLGASGVLIGWVTGEWFGIPRRRRVRGLVLAASLFLAMIFVFVGIPALTDVSRGELLSDIGGIFVTFTFALAFVLIAIALLRVRGVISPGRRVMHSPLAALILSFSLFAYALGSVLEPSAYADILPIAGSVMALLGFMLENRAKQRAGA